MLRSPLPVAFLILLTYLTRIITAAPAPVPAGPILPNQSTYLILSADISQPWSSVQGTNPEQFEFTIVGQWTGAIPVNCSLSWNAGVANVTDAGLNKVDVSFNNCTDETVQIDMTRFRVEPWFLWQLNITARYVVLQMPSFLPSIFFTPTSGSGFRMVADSSLISVGLILLSGE